MSLSVSRLALVFLLAAFQYGCASFERPEAGRAAMAQVPVTESPTGEVYHGKFIWHDLITLDVVAAGKFYEQLFGWQLEYHGNYAVARNDGKLVAGILQVNPAESQKRDAVWIPSVSVADLDAAIVIAESKGGTVLKGPVMMGLRGRAALISDPQRADVVLLSAKGGDPVDEEAQTGDWLWDEIWTDDPQLIGEFYTSVLGYGEFMYADDYGVFMRQGQWRWRYASKSLAERYGLRRKMPRVKAHGID